MKRHYSKALSCLAIIVIALFLVTNSTLAGVMMQGFYWDVPADGNWWNIMASKAYELRYMAGGKGINRIWFPPASKGLTGINSMGYDPYDYYDLGTYYQHGTTNTRFGSQDDLKAAISTFKSYDISCMGDIVLNHRSGGNSQYNPYTSYYTYTDFSNTASGKCQWDYNSFHPNGTCISDEGTFAEMPDICYVSGSAYNDIKTWLSWLMDSNNAGFDSWRFDYVKGFPSWVVKDMIAATDAYGIGEYWDGDPNALNTWANSSTADVFDFALYYTMRDICNDTSGGGYLPNVFDWSKSLAAKSPENAVTFAAIHDTDEIIKDKMMAYAFILTYQGYPCIFWKDYFDYNLATSGGAGKPLWGNGIKQLVWCREKLANGTPNIQILKSDDGNCIIYGSDGHSTASPGYIVVINDHATNWHGYTVQTSNGFLKGKNLKCYAWSSSVDGQNTQPQSKYCDNNGYVELWAPPRGYAVYAPEGL